jgi:hypothetical protein
MMGQNQRGAVENAAVKETSASRLLKKSLVSVA